jgi:hypothetical protein
MQLSITEVADKKLAAVTDLSETQVPMCISTAMYLGI